MSYVSSKGKLWNVGGNPDNFPASDRMLWSLHLASGRKRDFRKNRPSQGEARDILKKLNEERRLEKKRPRGDQMEAAYYSGVMQKAITAANAAGLKWLNENEPKFVIYHPEEDWEEEVYGAIGEVRIKWPHKRSKFGLWLRAYHFDGQYEFVNIPHNFVDRREYDLQMACEEASLRVFNNYGVLGLKLHKHKFY